MRQLCRLTWRWIPCRSLGRWCGSLCFFLGTFASWEMCWDLLGYEMIWNVVQTCPKPLLSQFLSPGPLVPLMFSKMSSKHIKASPVILYTFIYIYVYKHIITYVDISSWFQNMCMASKSSRLDTTRDDVFLLSSQAAQGMRPDEACYRNDRHNRTWERWEMNAHLRILRNVAVFSNFLNMKFII